MKEAAEKKEAEEKKAAEKKKAEDKKKAAEDVDNSTGVVVGIIVACVIAIGAAVAGGFFYMQSQKQEASSHDTEMGKRGVKVAPDLNTTGYPLQK